MRLHLPLPATYETSTSPDGTLRAQLPSGATLTVPPLRPIPEDIWYWASSAQEVDLPAGAHTRQVRVQEARTALGWTNLVGLGLVVQVGGQGLIAYGVGRLPIVASTVLLWMQPLVAAVLSWILFDETLGALALLGATLILGGIYVVQRYRA